MLIDPERLVDFCLVDSFCRIHDTGQHRAIFEEFNDPIALVVCSPIASDMAVKHVRNSILPFDVVLVMFVAMKYCFQILLLFHQLNKGSGFNGMFGLFDRRDMDEQKDVICCFVFFEFLGQPFKIGWKVFSFLVGCCCKQQDRFFDDHIKIEG